MASTERPDLREDLKILVDPSSKIIQNFKANMILPPIGVRNDSASFANIPIGDSEQPANLDKNADGTWKRFLLRYGKDSYTTSLKGLEYPVNDISQLLNEEWFNEQKVAAVRAYKKLLIGREMRVSVPMNTTTNFTSRIETATEYYDDRANSLPLADVDKLALIAFTNTGFEKEQLSYIIPKENIPLIVASEDYASKSKYTTDPTKMTFEQQVSAVAAYLQVKEVIPVSGTYNTSGWGDNSASFVRMWSKQYQILALLPDSTSDWSDTCCGRTPYWLKYGATGSYKMESYYEKAKDQLIIRASEYCDPKFFWDYAFMLQSCRKP